MRVSIESLVKKEKNSSITYLGGKKKRQLRFNPPTCHVVRLCKNIQLYHRLSIEIDSILLNRTYG